MTENHRKKIMQWPNSGEGYTPVVRNSDFESDAASDDISVVKEEIIKICADIGGTKNEKLMSVLKEFVPSGNPNGIKSLEDAKECLAKIKGIKPVE